VPALRSSGRLTSQYEIEIVTPMVGGGVQAGVNDLRFPVRETTIRGHLRHWWRLTSGQLFLSDTAALWQREEEIFGSTEFPSPLEVRVLGRPQIQRCNPGDLNPLAYALFAAIAHEQDVAREGIRFGLQLSWPDTAELNQRRKAQNQQRTKDRKTFLPESIASLSTELEEAVRAWLAYGGLGARTRRGCGALVLLHETAGPSALPKIDARIFVDRSEKDAISAWKKALDVYRDFRQKPRGRDHLKKTPGGLATVPGRSHWPEADSIRQITGCALKPRAGTRPSGLPADEDTQDHATPVVPGEVLPSFPKAVLGLPINFHFADGPEKHRPGVADRDPGDVHLVPALKKEGGHWDDQERMASPVLTRPLWIEGHWHPALIILNTPWPQGYGARLKGKQANANGRDCDRIIPHHQIIDPRLRSVGPLRDQSDAIRALIKYLSTELSWEER
jgi:CRISPR-associated protein Cmr1